ncbi:MAG: proS [Parcubacteria group bacterium]|nr:proS [Parcubacteria group bacterium]
MKESITPRATDFSEWYQDVIDAADLAEHGPVRGTMVIKPYGYALWEATQKYLDTKFKETGVQNAYFPMLIPESFLKREEHHVEGFSPEVAVVTYAGGKELEEPLVVRPTSETIMYDVFSRWIRSHRDLPLLINQWANVVRWEMRPRLFMRTTEFLWQEGHTAHATEQEADERARQMLEVYQRFAEDVMAIPVIPGQKSESEKFAGALHTYTIVAIMQDGKALQFATSHNLGQNFAKAFDVKFTDESNNSAYVWQTSWGLSTRTIGGLIMVHSDDKGLVLPPRIAPIQIVIIPIWRDEETKEKVLKKTEELRDELSVFARVHIDARDGRPGEKHYHWEKKGVPIRIELGPRDVDNNTMVLVRRDNGEKILTEGKDFGKVEEALGDIQNNLYAKALARNEQKIKKVDTWDEFKQAIEDGFAVLAHWSKDAGVEQKIKEETKATVRCIPFNQEMESGKCVYSGEPSEGRVLFARAY